MIVEGLIRRHMGLLHRSVPAETAQVVAVSKTLICKAAMRRGACLQDPLRHPRIQESKIVASTPSYVPSTTLPLNGLCAAP